MIVLFCEEVVDNFSWFEILIRIEETDASHSQCEEIDVSYSALVCVNPSFKFEQFLFTWYILNGSNQKPILVPFSHCV